MLEALTIHQHELLQAEIWNQAVISGKTLLSILNLISAILFKQDLNTLKNQGYQVKLINVLLQSKINKCIAH